MKFKGDIIITDPCYLDSYNRDLDDWWIKFLRTDELSDYGFTSYIVESTIIGDWSWETIDLDTHKTLGTFCADAGMVCVCLLDEVLKFNPKFAEFIEDSSHCVTVIKDFNGEIEYYIDEDNNFHIKGTGNINFITA